MNKKCLLFGHKLKVLNDEKTVWCDRCEKKMIVMKKPYGFEGINMVIKTEPRLLINIPKIIGLLSLIIIGLYYVIK